MVLDMVIPGLLGGVDVTSAEQQYPGIGLMISRVEGLGNGRL